MDIQALQGLVYNVALLLSLGLLYESIFLKDRFRSRFLRDGANGIFLSLIVMAVMLTPVKFIPGIVFDTRTILLGAAGLFFGAVPTMIAMLAASVLRIAQGGGGVGMGVATILTSGLIGICWHHCRRNRLEDIPVRELALAGLAVHAVMLGCAFLLPAGAYWEVFRRLGLIIILVYPVGMTLLGLLMRQRLQRHVLENRLADSERTLRSYFDNAPDGIFIVDGNGRHLDANPAGCRITGYSRDELLKLGILALVPEDQHNKVQRHFREVVESGMTTGDVPYVRKDGVTGIWTVSAVKLADDLFLSLAKDITERIAIQDDLRRSLQEKEVLLKELYHRTKNNMQVITSLLQLQAARHDEEGVRQVVKATTERIRVLALVHQKLYQSRDLSGIVLGEYLAELGELILGGSMAEPGALTVAVAAEPFSVVIDLAIPCGLVVNELLANSLKHAFPEGKGSVRISAVRDESGEITIEYRDNGPGLPEGLDYRQAGSMGMQIMVSICEHQLGGSIDFPRGEGLVCRIRFNDNLYGRRV